MTERYAVVGNPVAHSLSPRIHAEFARQTGHDIEYVRVLAPRDDFRGAVFKFRAEQGGRGMNVTLPFKRDAWTLVDERRGDAAQAQAVNVIEFSGSRMIGHNTDGTGLLTDIEENLGFEICDKRVLLMGAGGATYGVVQPLLEAQPALLIVANRTVEKAKQLVAHFQQLQDLPAQRIEAQPYQQLAGQQFDLVINATSAGLSDEMPPLPHGCLAIGALAYDMVYGKQTPFMSFAAKEGVRTADGLGMLVEQAAESFLIWRRVRPATAPVIELLRKTL